MNLAEPTHIPVLVNEVLRALVERPEQQVASSRGAGSDAPARSQGRKPEERLFIDGTVGQGGHAEQLLAALPGCRLLGFDRDPVNLSIAKKRLERFSDRAVLVHDRYANAPRHAHAHGFTDVDGILLDLGFSSAHVDEAERGFSFMQEGPLDMRYDTRQELSAEGIVNKWTREDLSTIFRRFGEDPRSAIIAKAIVDARRSMRIDTTYQLAEIVASVVPRQGKIHPATRIFQALRIVVNDELGEVERGLTAALEKLNSGGRCAVITFHSLEDRLVKNLFKTQQGLLHITKKPIIASEEEAKANPRSRSAKLRIAEKLAT